MIGVLGAGAFGTALAVSFSRNSGVVMVAHGEDHAGEMRRTRRNDRKLPDVALSDAIEITADPAALRACEVVLLCVPTQALRGGLDEARDVLSGKTLVACCKGVERGTQKRPTQIVQDVLSDAVPAVLTGPSFAADIARGLPTALTLACAHEARGVWLQEVLTAPHLRLYRTTDATGAELGGALKNVVAIACGAAIGAGLGESARAALMTRGYAEMVRMARALGAEAETLAGLSGLGDLALTCMSEQSRNLRFGLSLGREEAFDEGVTVEGAKTAHAVQERARSLAVEMPITGAVVALVDGELRVREAMDMLLARPLKEE